MLMRPTPGMSIGPRVTVRAEIDGFFGRSVNVVNRHVIHVVRRRRVAAEPCGVDLIKSAGRLFRAGR